jgi:hypothetical protein
MTCSCTAAQAASLHRDLHDLDVGLRVDAAGLEVRARVHAASARQLGHRRRVATTCFVGPRSAADPRPPPPTPRRPTVPNCSDHPAPEQRSGTFRSHPDFCSRDLRSPGAEEWARAGDVQRGALEQKSADGAEECGWRRFAGGFLTLGRVGSSLNCCARGFWFGAGEMHVICH